MKKPNIIYILADDMGYGDVSALNENCAFKTTYIDQMCENGLAFTDAHTTSSVCTPSRYGILTGRYNWRSRLKSQVMGGYSSHLIEDGRTTLATLLKRNGYYTCAIGKWHLGMDFETFTDFEERPNYYPLNSDNIYDGVDYSKAIKFSPITNGFDYYYGISASLDMPPYTYIENDRFTKAPTFFKTVEPGKSWYRPGPCADDFIHEEVLDNLCDKVLQQIDNHKNSPFFIYFPMPAPHGPILPTKEFFGKSGTNEYGDFVLQCDDVVGRITRKVEELGISDNTIIVFTTDNGCSPIADIDELSQFNHNPSYVFRGMKADIYEGGHRIPYVIQWPNKIPQHSKCDKTVCLCDFMSTIAEYLGDTLSDNEAVDSVSNLSLWYEPKSDPVREYTVHQSVNGSLAIRKGNYKLEMCLGSGGWSYPKGNIESLEGYPSFQLYNLADDIGETTNIINQNQEIFIELRDILIKCIKDGRSTKGAVQKNDGEKIWCTIKWIEEFI
ncbi:MAG: arylsulfatase [Clostridia bacterium]